MGYTTWGVISIGSVPVDTTSFFGSGGGGWTTVVCLQASSGGECMGSGLIVNTLFT